MTIAVVAQIGPASWIIGLEVLQEVGHGVATGRIDLICTGVGIIGARIVVVGAGAVVVGTGTVIARRQQRAAQQGAGHESGARPKASTAKASTAKAPARKPSAAEAPAGKASADEPHRFDVRWRGIPECDAGDRHGGCGAGE